MRTRTRARRGRRRALLALCVASVVVGCSPEESPPASAPEPRTADAPLEVRAVNEPLRAMAERIGGAEVNARLPVPPEVDPADWMPTADEVAAFQSADLILRNGAGYASWMDRVTLRRSRVVETSSAFRQRWIPVEGSVTHAHGRGAAHTHEGFESTTWLDPGLAILQARAVEAALARLRPAAAGSFAQHLAGLEADLAALDARLAAAAQRIGDAPLLFSHPVYGYLIRRCALNARSLHWEPEEPPGHADWRELDRLRREHPAAWMLWEAEPLAATREALRDRGVESAVFAPGGNAVEGGFLALMARNAGELERVADALAR